ncbi:MAG: hypothetical protein M3304_03765 [Actinomycetota bacterium]|nr:hypothetical protein [Actinomycetota bacterium]
MRIDLLPTHIALCLALGLVALAPSRPRKLAASRALGLVFPGMMLAAGVAAVVATRSGADTLTALAAVATPVLAGLSGWLLRWRRPWATALLAGLLYALAWLKAGTLVGEAAGVLLIAGACLTIAALLRGLASPRTLAAGVVLVASLDVLFVWVLGDMAPTMAALDTIARTGSRLDETTVPSLQVVTLGPSMMGWLDLLAPALVGTMLPRSWRMRIVCAGSIVAAALTWGLLHAVSPLIPATVPSLAGFAPVLLGAFYARSRRVVGVATASPS